MLYTNERGNGALAMKHRVICTFCHNDQLENALSQLRERGFTYNESDVVLSRFDLSRDDAKDDESFYATKASIYMGALLGAAMSGASNMHGVGDWLLLATGAICGATLCGTIGAIIGASIAGARSSIDTSATQGQFTPERANSSNVITFKTKSALPILDASPLRSNLNTMVETNLIVTVLVDPDDSIHAVEKICRLAGAGQTLQVSDAA